jgi:cytochrome P450
MIQHYQVFMLRCVMCACSVIPGLHRVASKGIELGGYAVPAGTMLYTPLHLLTKSDPRWTEDDPEAFR